MVAIEISTLAELDAVRNDLAADYVLVNDIDASDTSTWNSGAGFKPINNFTGTFDGNGHTISNLYINRPTEDWVGLFRKVNGGTLQNVIMTGLDITASSRVGMVGETIAQGLIKNCHVSGTITGSQKYPGLISGAVNDSIVEQCSSTGSVSGNSSGYAGGGLIGYMLDGAVLKNSHSDADVTMTDKAGGAVGWVEKVDTIIQNCYSIGTVSAPSYEGGLVGRFDGLGTISNSYYDTETSGQSDTGKGEPRTTAEMQTQETFADWDFDTVWTMDGYPALRVFYPDLETDDEGVIEIGTLSELNAIRYDLAASYKLTADIDASITREWNLYAMVDKVNDATEWDSGTKTNTIVNAEDNLTLDTGQTSGTWLQKWNLADIRDLANSKISFDAITPTDTSVTVEAGLGDETTEPASYTAVTSGDSIPGTAVNDDLSANYLYIKVSLGTTGAEMPEVIQVYTEVYSNEYAGFDPMGNFTGTFDGNGHTISNLYINRPTEDWVGLFRKVNGGTLQNVTMTGLDITALSRVGMVGEPYAQGLIKNCHVSGTITGLQRYSGLISGAVNDSIVEQCSSTGSVSGNSSGIVGGGLIGYMLNGAVLKNSHSDADVTMTYRAGGAVGVVESADTTVQNCYSIGTVSAPSYEGGLVGFFDELGTISNSYYDTETSGQSDTGKGEPRTTAELKQSYPISKPIIESFDLDKIIVRNNNLYDAVLTMKRGNPLIKNDYSGVNNLYSSINSRFKYIPDNTTPFIDSQMDGTGNISQTFDNDNYAIYIGGNETTGIRLSVSPKQLTVTSNLDDNVLYSEDYNTTDTTVFFGGIALDNSNIYIECEDMTTANGASLYSGSDASGGSAVKFDAQDEMCYNYFGLGTDLPLGTYKLVVRAKQDSAVTDDLTMNIRNKTEASIFATENKTLSLGWEYYIFDVTFTEAVEGDVLSLELLKNTTTSNNIYVDYVVWLPISSPNKNFPKDLAHQALVESNSSRELIGRL